MTEACFGCWKGDKMRKEIMFLALCIYVLLIIFIVGSIQLFMIAQGEYATFDEVVCNNPELLFLFGLVGGYVIARVISMYGERIEKMKGEKRMSIKNNKLVCPNCEQEFISEDAYEEVRKTIKEIEKIIIKPPQRAKILTGNNEEVLGFILKKDWEKIKGEKG